MEGRRAIVSSRKAAYSSNLLLENPMETRLGFLFSPRVPGLTTILNNCTMGIMGAAKLTVVVSPRESVNTGYRLSSGCGISLDGFLDSGESTQRLELTKFCHGNRILQWTPTIESCEMDSLCDESRRIRQSLKGQRDGTASVRSSCLLRIFGDRVLRGDSTNILLCLASIAACGDH